jgi:hypothetical protein
MLPVIDVMTNHVTCNNINSDILIEGEIPVTVVYGPQQIPVASSLATYNVTP